jgi:hypothetical protein
MDAPNWATGGVSSSGPQPYAPAPPLSLASPSASSPPTVPAPSPTIPLGWTALSNDPTGANRLVQDPSGQQWLWNATTGQFQTAAPDLLSLMGLSAPAPAPEAPPSALAPFSTQQSQFSSMFGLSNPLLLPLLLLLMNRPTTMVPFPGLLQVPEVPGGAATIPDFLPTPVQPGAPGPDAPGTFRPFGTGHGAGAGGESGDGRRGATGPFSFGWLQPEANKGLLSSPNTTNVAGPKVITQPGAAPSQQVTTTAPTLEDVQRSAQFQAEQQRLAGQGGGQIQVVGPNNTIYTIDVPEWGATGR